MPFWWHFPPSPYCWSVTLSYHKNLWLNPSRQSWGAKSCKNTPLSPSLSLLPVHLGQKRQFSVRPLPCGQHSVRSQPRTLLASVHYSALALKLLYLSSPKMKTSTAPFFDLNGTPQKWKGRRGELWIFVTNKLTASPKPLSPLHGTLRLMIGA